MTLIASTLNYRVPFIIGDLLISAINQEKSVILPVHPSDITSHLENDFLMPYGLRQKIYVITPSVCLAMAGNVGEMTNFLKEIRIICAIHEEITEQKIETFLRDYKLEENFGESIYLITLVEKVNEDEYELKYLTNKLWRSLDNDAFQTIRAKGSGEIAFLHHANDQGKLTIGQPKGTLSYAKAVNFSYLARLHAAERAGLATIKDFWGSGFEVVYLNGKEFKKFDKMSYVVIDEEFDKDGNIGDCLPCSITHYHYHDDILCIYAFEVYESVYEQTDTAYIISTSNYTLRPYAVPPLDRKIDYLPDELPQDFSFSSREIAVGYAVRTTDGFVTPSFYIEGNGIEITYQHEGELRIVMPMELANEVRSGLKEIFTNL